jgi:hypothetical protein
MKDGVPRRVIGPAVTAFDAQTEAEASGVTYTPDQWSFTRRKSEVTTRPIPVETLKALRGLCRKPLAHTCPTRRK